ncbi:hypothetical protein [Sphingomonas sp. MA1305]|uniref:hypothetical protein n=1 Tax=Sphingomonas sp. MA1305 TaxID=2479204 RepID=UPI0018E030CE|nr:hypothetical protein [Sphingomonas sp. MA1305]
MATAWTSQVNEFAAARRMVRYRASGLLVSRRLHNYVIAMSTRPLSIIERAIELAKSGACHSLADIRHQLAAERYENVHGHTTGASIQKQLRDLLVARGAKGAERDEDE